jgi:predicted N-acetyltransferase YhbS
VDVVVTYGDPSYYTKSGFHVITEDQIAAPYKLQFPEGWLAQSLNGKPLPNLPEPCRCVAEFDDPQFW